MLIHPNLHHMSRQVTRPSCLPLTPSLQAALWNLTFPDTRTKNSSVPAVEGEGKKKKAHRKRRWCSFTKHKTTFVPVPAPRRCCWVTGPRGTSATVDTVSCGHPSVTCRTWLSACVPASRGWGCSEAGQPSFHQVLSRERSRAHWALSGQPEPPEPAFLLLSTKLRMPTWWALNEVTYEQAQCTSPSTCVLPLPFICPC